jgi:radical SAM protein with 4Fe4S-binding SPASM domain
MDSFRKAAYFRLARNFILSKPRVSQIQNFLKYKYHTAFGSLPEEIYGFTPISQIICVTRRCNLHCSFCHSLDKLNCKTAWEYELDAERLRKILYHPLVRNCLRINFTGGEPFLNKHIFDLIHMVREQGHLVTVGTNGTLIHNLLHDILRTGINSLGISLYEENTDKLYNNIPLVSGKIFIKLHKVIFSDALEDIYKTVSMAVDLKVDGVLFQNFYPSKEKNVSRCVFDDNEYYPAIREEIERKYKDKMDIVWFAPLPREISTAPRRCRMVWQNLKIDAQGNIGACCFTFPDGERFGNMFEDENVWNNKFFIGMRRMMKNPAIPLPPMCKKCYLLTENLYGI